MALGSVKIAKVTIPANMSVSVLVTGLGLTPSQGTLSYSVLVYDPQSESLNVALADSAGTPTDPTAMMPAQDNPFFIESTSADVFLYNMGSTPVVVTCMAWAR